MSAPVTLTGMPPADDAPDAALLAQVCAILARHARRDPAGIAADTTLEALGLDSLALVEAIFALEEAFDITIPFNANTPGDSGLTGASVAAVAARIAALKSAASAGA